MKQPNWVCVEKESVGFSLVQRCQAEFPYLWAVACLYLNQIQPFIWTAQFHGLGGPWRSHLVNVLHLRNCMKNIKLKIDQQLPQGALACSSCMHANCLVF